MTYGPTILDKIVGTLSVGGLWAFPRIDKTPTMFNTTLHYTVTRLLISFVTTTPQTQKKDIQRKHMCKEMGIRLICIPYNSSCVVGMLRRRLKTPNDCPCYDCLNMARLSGASRPGRAEKQRLLDINEDISKWDVWYLWRSIWHCSWEHQ